VDSIETIDFPTSSLQSYYVRRDYLGVFGSAQDGRSMARREHVFNTFHYGATSALYAIAFDRQTAGKFRGTKKVLRSHLRRELYIKLAYDPNNIHKPRSSDFPVQEERISPRLYSIKPLCADSRSQTETLTYSADALCKGPLASDETYQT